MSPDQRRREAFLHHLSNCESTLRAFIAGALAAAHERADFFQEVALILWRRYDDYDAARPFLPWAMGVAARRMKEEYRRVARRPGLLSAEQLDRLANELAASEERNSSADEEAALAACLAALPEASARLVQRRYYERASIESLGTESGQSAAAIYQTLSRLRRSLAECIRRRLRRAELNANLNPPSSMNADPDFHPLAAAWLDGTATPPEQRLLGEILHGPDTMREYAALCRTEALLTHSGRAASARRAALSAILGGNSLPRRAAGLWRHRAFRWAAAIAVLATVTWAFWPSAASDQNETVRNGRVIPRVAGTPFPNNTPPGASHALLETRLPPPEKGVEEWLRRYYVRSFDAEGALPNAAAALAGAVTLEDGQPLTADVRSEGDAAVHIKLGVSLPAWRLVQIMAFQSGTEAAISGRTIVFRAAKKPKSVEGTTGAGAALTGLRALFALPGKSSAEEPAVFAALTHHAFGSRIRFRFAEESYLNYEGTPRDVFVLDCAQTAQVLPAYFVNFTLRALSLPADSFPDLLAKACGIHAADLQNSVLTDIQMQALLRDVANTSGVDLLNMPVMTTAPNQEVHVNSNPAPPAPPNGFSGRFSALVAGNGEMIVTYSITASRLLEEVHEIVVDETGKYSCQAGSTRAIRGREESSGRDVFFLLTAALTDNTGILTVDPGEPSEAPPQEELPYGIPVAGKKGMVQSPYAPEKGQIDVEGLSRGTRVKCPYTGKHFRVP